MKFACITAASLIAATLGWGSVNADCRQRVIVNRNVAVAAVVVDNVALATTFVPVQVPVYTHNFIGGDYNSLREEIKSLRSEIQQLRVGVKEAPAVDPKVEPKQAAAGDHLKVMGQSCASCHTDGALKGNAFAIFTKEGALNPLSHKQVLRILSRVASGEMPPAASPQAKEFSQESFATMVSWAKKVSE